MDFGRCKKGPHVPRVYLEQVTVVADPVIFQVHGVIHRYYACLDKGREVERHRFSRVVNLHITEALILTAASAFGLHPEGFTVLVGKACPQFCQFPRDIVFSGATLGVDGNLLQPVTCAVDLE